MPPQVSRPTTATHQRPLSSRRPPARQPPPPASTLAREPSPSRTTQATRSHGPPTRQRPASRPRSALCATSGALLLAGAGGKGKGFASGLRRACVRCFCCDRPYFVCKRLRVHGHELRCFCCERVDTRATVVRVSASGVKEGGGAALVKRYVHYPPEGCVVAHVRRCDGPRLGPRACAPEGAVGMVGEGGGGIGRC